MPACGERRHDEVEEDVVLAPHELRRPGPGSRVSCSPGRSPSAERVRTPAATWSLSAGDPHLEELVEQLREDGEELHPLEQRQAVVLGQVEQPRAEVEPRQLPVGEALVPEGLDLLVRRWDRAFDGGRLRGHRDRNLGLVRGRGLRLGLLRLGLGHGCEVQRRSAEADAPSILPLTSTIRPVPSRTRRTPLPRYVWGPKPKRRTELGLLLFGSLLIVALLRASPSWERNRRSRRTSGRFSAIVLGLALAAHIANRWLAPDANAGHPAPRRPAERDRLRRHRSLERRPTPASRPAGSRWACCSTS